MNWGVVVTDDEPAASHIYPADILATVKFSTQDTTFLTALELKGVVDAEAYGVTAKAAWALNIQLESAFETLMCMSRSMGDEWGLVDSKEWINDLVWLLPAYAPDATAQRYIDGRVAPSLTAFYVTALRSDFWNLCLTHLGVEDRIDMAGLCPDIVELSSMEDPPPRNVTAYEARHRETSRLLQRAEGDPARQLFLQLDVVTYVAAAQVPALGQFLAAYQQWLEQEVPAS
jgi:hypothetical protein